MLEESDPDCQKSEKISQDRTILKRKLPGKKMAFFFAKYLLAFTASKCLL